MSQYFSVLFDVSRMENREFILCLIWIKYMYSIGLYLLLCAICKQIHPNYAIMLMIHGIFFVCSRVHFSVAVISFAYKWCFHMFFNRFVCLPPSTTFIWMRILYKRHMQKQHMQNQFWRWVSKKKSAHTQHTHLIPRILYGVFSWAIVILHSFSEFDLEISKQPQITLSYNIQ